jgi:tetratricopeptide (TPR) repeat protein
MNNYRINRFQKELEDNISLAIRKGNQVLKRDDDPWIHFYVGAAYGYQALNRFRKQDWIGAYMDSRRGIDHFKEALAKEPGLYDVYLAVGSYHYWRTAKSKFLRIIAFFMADKRELGLRQIEFSIRHGLYSPNEASYGLIVAYFDSGQYEKAFDAYNRWIAKKNAPNISDLYYRARLLLQFRRWPEAEVLFRDVLQRLEDYQFPSIGFQVEVTYWIALTLKEQDKIPEALHLTEKALGLSEKRNPDSELDGPFEDFQEIRNRLESLHRDLKQETEYVITKEKDEFSALAGASPNH